MTAFVWADTTGADFASTGANQFLIRASGGVGIGLANPVAALDVAGTVRATAFTGNGAGLAGLNADNLASGTVVDARLSPNIPRLDANQTFTGVVGLANPANSFTGNGAGLTTLNASQLASGTVADGRLSANAPRLNGSATFAGTVSAARFSGAGAMDWQVVSGTAQQAQPNTGYLLTNDTQVVVTLPTSPNPGGIVRVSGVGTGGWRITQNSSQLVLAKNLPGTFGTSWTPRDSVRDWRSVASSTDGTKLVALVSGGQIYTSTDSGVTWTPRDSSRTWSSVASSTDGTKLVAAVSGGQIYTSTDSGATWTPRDSSRGWFSVASSSDGTKLVAVDGFGSGSGGQIHTSTDSGVTWAADGSSQDWSSVASSADGSKLVAVVNGGQIYTFTDSDATLTPRESNRSWRSVASSADGSKLVAVADGGQIYTYSSADPPGTTGYLLGDQLSAIELQYIGNGQFMPLSHEGTIIAY